MLHCLTHGSRNFEMLETNYLMTPCHMPEECIPQLHQCKIPKTRNNIGIILINLPERDAATS